MIGLDATCCACTGCRDCILAVLIRQLGRRSFGFDHALSAHGCFDREICAQATNNGGAIQQLGGNITIARSSFVQNSAGAIGGGYFGSDVVRSLPDEHKKTISALPLIGRGSRAAKHAAWLLVCVR